MTSAPAVRRCPTCGQDSMEIFTIGWTCLNDSCQAYYSGMDDETLRNLTYTPAFLNMRTPFTPQEPLTLVPPMPRFFDDQGNVVVHGTEKEAHIGFVCRTCGCASRRIFWNQLICENPTCGTTYPAPMLPYPPHMLANDVAALDTKLRRFRLRSGLPNDHNDPKFNLAFVLHPSISALDKVSYGSYTAWTYLLPGPNGAIIGSFTLFQANNIINEAPNGPTDMFREIELLELGLRRNPSACPGREFSPRDCDCIAC